MTQAPAVLRICVSKAKNVEWNGGLVATGIFKLPVEGKVKVRRLNLDGDEQADLTVHGGRDKAVYAYPSEHYGYWKQELPERDLEWGSFGENLTTSGFDQTSLCIGDKLQIGTAQFVVTQPRMPCFKLGIRLADPGMVRRFFRSGKWGYYLAVLEEGEIGAGDQITHLGGDGNGVTLADVSQCFTDPSVDAALLAKVFDSNLAMQMKEHLEYQIARKKQ
ncbi:MAG: MOSC domain-containing protein [Cyanobacteria bacterium REEB67]|nr:MOSC domain-containing protein [Cyanobacteria bacterium REEB67]